MSRNNRRNQQRRKQAELYPDLPKKAAFLGDLLDFAEWLVANGRDPIEPQNEFETARWRNQKGITCIIYHDAQGNLRWLKDSAEDFRIYLKEVDEWRRTRPERDAVRQDNV